MSHKPVIIEKIALRLSERVCFEEFSAQIQSGSRILIIGNNGAGKSTLIKMIQGVIDPSEGSISRSSGLVFGYVPQTVMDYSNLSGGQRFNKVLSVELSKHPDILCLDEPTNHLDLKNKRSLIRMFKSFKSTLIIISHDPEIMALDFDQIWHIENGQINVFKGSYAAYLQELDYKEKKLVSAHERLHKEKNILRKAEQQEKKRSSSRRSVNRYENDKNLLGAMKEKGSRSSGKVAKRFADVEQKIKADLRSSFVHKKIEPNFNFNNRHLSPSKSIVSIISGSCGYDKPVIHDINLQVKPAEHIGIIGNNGVGKSTLLKALLGDPSIEIDGEWLMPQRKNIGYLDQYYSTLNVDQTVFEVIQTTAVSMNDKEIQKRLNDFLFSKPHELSKKVSSLSGGEKARLSLAQIAVTDCYLLLLDEVTNNVDLDTRRHIVQVLREYPGAMIIVTHDLYFFEQLGVKTVYEIASNLLRPVSLTN